MIRDNNPHLQKRDSGNPGCFPVELFEETCPSVAKHSRDVAFSAKRDWHSQIISVFVPNRYWLQREDLRCRFECTMSTVENILCLVDFLDGFETLLIP